jgi:hypothetical protein
VYYVGAANNSNIKTSFMVLFNEIEVEQDGIAGVLRKR